MSGIPIPVAPRSGPRSGGPGWSGLCGHLSGTCRRTASWKRSGCGARTTTTDWIDALPIPLSRQTLQPPCASDQVSAASVAGDGLASLPASMGASPCGVSVAVPSVLLAVLSIRPSGVVLTAGQHASPNQAAASWRWVAGEAQSTRAAEGPVQGWPVVTGVDGSTIPRGLGVGCLVEVVPIRPPWLALGG